MQPDAFTLTIAVVCAWLVPIGLVVSLIIKGRHRSQPLDTDPTP